MSITQDILDKDGNIIGEISFPDDTSDAVISIALMAYTEVAEIPDVTPRQIRQALILSGVSLQYIDDAIDSLEEPYKSLARTEWEYSVAFQRNRPLVAQIAAALGWTSEQLDALWLLAGTL